MPPRRSHKKSRAGCRRCKTRKIKCDEVHPRCGNCLKHGVACDFEHPELADELQSLLSADTPKSETPAATPAVTVSTPFDFNSPLPANSSASDSPGRVALITPLYTQPHNPPVSSTTPATSRLLELRLLHQYSTNTCHTLSFSSAATDKVWRDTVPNIAFSGSDHLADAVLAVAALHLRSLQPNDRELIRASHGYMASSLRAYSETLTKGIQSTANAEALFLTSTFIAFQSTATRIFSKDELSLNTGAVNGFAKTGGPPGGYAIPLSWFHAFQGVKAITAASWPWLRQSRVVIPIIESQPVLQLDFSNSGQQFFDHLLDGLDEELAELPDDDRQEAAAPHSAQTGAFSGGIRPTPGQTLAASTRQAYEHAVAVLNWAHKIPHKGAPLAFPATVSRRYVELLEERKPRALAVLACFFALLKSVDSAWWLQGMSRREVLGVASLFSSDYFGLEVERRWWPHLEWAVRVALYDDSANPGFVPPEIWGTKWMNDESVMAARGSESFVSHIDMLSQLVGAVD
ncbi:uncharacterized protein E0L32_003876 [Thyridium curvatum]|uniref:Zn(2)-C6 fungal-type domain-containing protein n=1 Tax=Thyridium curvatum TaxID=1093900 RepID=A0A507B2T3_9PEZI|nr:uncharacterized protein E0L32_003876 [Thyridium curvatum]TPX16582.1 hypothetical protein E0L32_003876 [Thyridium curvatum]